MCLLIFIKISAVTVCGQQFYRNIKSTKIKKIYVVRRVIRFFYYSASLGFGIAEYNDRPLIEKKLPGGGLSWKMKSIVPDLSEKIMACMTVVRQ